MTATGSWTSWWCSTSRPVRRRPGSTRGVRCSHRCSSRPASVATCTTSRSPASAASRSQAADVARVVVYAIAYRGDVLPYAPVAAELARRGHDVVFVAPTELHPQLAARGVTLVDADAGEMTPSGLDAYGDYCARWGRVASGAMLMRLYYGRLTVPRADAPTR